MTDILNGKYFLHFDIRDGEIKYLAKLIGPIGQLDYLATLLDFTSGDLVETTQGLIPVNDDMGYASYPHLIFDTKEELVAVLKKIKVLEEVHEQKKKFMLTDLMPNSTALLGDSSKDETKPSV